MSPRQGDAGPALLLRAALIIFAISTALATPADADLWGHLRFGRDILTTGQIVQADTYAFTSDRVWINHEWLSEIILAGAFEAGPTGLIALKLLIVGTVLWCVWARWKDLHRPRGGLAVLVTIAFLGTYWRLHTMRPQLFSVLLFAVMLLCLTRADAGRRRYLALIPLTMALWANLHGGWIVGLGVLGLWAMARVIDPRLPEGFRVAIISTVLLSIAVTLANPYGWHLWQFLADTVRLERSDIEDWVPIVAHPLALGVPWGLGLVAAAIAIWKAEQRPRIEVVLVLAALLVLSFRVSRLDAFFGLAIAMLLAPQLSTAFAFLAPPTIAASRGILVITGIAIVAMLIPAAQVAGPYVRCISIDGDWTPDQQASRFIARNRLSGTMLTWFDWGEYAIWHFGPALKVSMDGRRETVYSEQTLKAHRRFYAADETAPEYLRSLNPDFIWLPIKLPIAGQLESAGWRPIFKSDQSAVWSRSIDTWLPVSDAATAPRCFPGP